MWVTKRLISEVKKRIFCQKTTKFGPKLAFLVNLGQAMQVFLVPCWWVSWRLWCVGCISQDTYLLYQYHHQHNPHLYLTTKGKSVDAFPNFEFNIVAFLGGVGAVGNVG